MTWPMFWLTFLAGYLSAHLVPPFYRWTRLQAQRLLLWWERREARRHRCALCGRPAEQVWRGLGVLEDRDYQKPFSIPLCAIHRPFTLSHEDNKRLAFLLANDLGWAHLMHQPREGQEHVQ